MKKLFFEGIESKDQPLLHALIIGIDHYPYLGPKGIARKLPPLDNLSSPSISANALASWLVEHKSWLSDAKLGSVDLIVAPVPPAGHAPKALAGSLETIGEAFDGWFDRCNTNTQNVALFYFCGHGLQKDNLLLLAENFGSVKNAPWMHAIDFDATYRGMSNCSAQTQYFIIDACRQWSQGLLQDLNTSGVSLLRADIRNQRPRTAVKLYGAASSLAAFGDTSGKPSRLARAVLACFEGKAAMKANGKWCVGVDRIGQAAQLLIEVGNRSLPTEQHQVINPAIGEFAVGNRTLLVLPDGIHPSALVEFDCDPNEATEYAQFYHRGIDPKTKKRGSVCTGAWSDELLAGIYDCGATITQHRHFKSKLLPHEIIIPPVRQVRVGPCTRRLEKGH